jgi:hypothetical protein
METSPRAMVQQTAPEPGGFGIILALRDLSQAVEGAPKGQRVWVKTIVPESPADRSNPRLEPGDELVQVIDDSGTQHDIPALVASSGNIDVVAKIMSGAAGTDATLALHHHYAGTRKAYSVKLTRRARSLDPPPPEPPFSAAKAVAALISAVVLAAVGVLVALRLPQLTALLPADPPLRQAVVTMLLNADSTAASLAAALGIPAALLSISHQRAPSTSSGVMPPPPSARARAPAQPRDSPPRPPQPP